MEHTNALKRSFIKNNVKKKFGESADRISNINRTILVMENGGKSMNTREYHEEIRQVQLKMDDLATKLEENKEKLDLDSIINKPPRSGWRNKREEVTDKDKDQGKQPLEGLSKIKLSEAGKIFIQANSHFYGHGAEKNIDLALDCYEQSAKMGNVNAQMALGKIYEEGVGVKADRYNAFVYYFDAAQRREPYAIYKCAVLMEKGEGEPDEEVRLNKAYQYYKLANDLGSTKARVRMAQILENGEFGVQEDKRKAYELYESVVTEEDEAMNSIGSICYAQQDYYRAVELFDKACEMGNAAAMNNLGTCYELGKGVDKDILRAYDLYEEAAAKGNAQAMSNLGFLYYKKAKFTNSAEQYLEAAHWFRFSISEDENLKDSHYYLGCMHMFGEGVDQSYNLAFH